MTPKQQEAFNRLELECIHYNQTRVGMMFLFNAMRHLTRELGISPCEEFEVRRGLVSVEDR